MPPVEVMVPAEQLHVVEVEAELFVLPLGVDMGCLQHVRPAAVAAYFVADPDDLADVFIEVLDYLLAVGLLADWCFAEASFFLLAALRTAGR